MPGKEKRESKEIITKTYEGCAVDMFPCKGVCREKHRSHCTQKFNIQLVVDRKGLRREFVNEKRNKI